MTKSEELENSGIKVGLVNDLIAVETIMEEIWSYHPDNKNKKDIISEYKALVKIKEEIENEIKELN
jgi:hypothetical protein